jgi:hypothetical protein
MNEEVKCPVCSQQWDGKNLYCPNCDFPIAQFKDLLSGKRILSDDDLVKEFYKEIEKHRRDLLSSSLILTVCLGHSKCILSTVRIKNDSSRILEPMEVLLSSDFFENRGFDFLTFVLSFFSSKRNIKPDGIAMSIPCPIEYVEGNTILHPHWSSWPNDIRSLQLKLGHEKVVLLNDAVAFALGCVHGQKIQKLQPPILFLTLGTGIGCALLIKNGENLKIQPIELFNLKRWWPVGPLGFEGDPHELAGAPFFHYVRVYTDWDAEETKRQFSLRIALIIKEIEKELKFNSVILGGGRTCFADPVEISKSTSKPVDALDQPEISVLGCAYGWALLFLQNKQITVILENPLMLS